LKRRSHTKQPHDPFELFLDEGLSGDAFAALLTKAKICVHKYEKLLRKNRKIPDPEVIAACSKANFILVSKDPSMERDWIEDIIECKAKVLFLSDKEGGIMHWTAALMCSRKAWERAFLDHPNEPMLIRITNSGGITKITGEADLRKRRTKLMTTKISRAKKAGEFNRAKLVGQTA